MKVKSENLKVKDIENYFSNFTFSTSSFTLSVCHDANASCASPASAWITDLVDDIGDIVAHYEYSPFGVITTDPTGTLFAANPFRFSSEYFDDTTGLIEYKYRKYNPDLGKFLSRDPIEEQGGLNLYAICGNDLINFWDEWGLAKECGITLVVGHFSDPAFEEKLRQQIEYYDNISASCAAVFPLTCANVFYKDDVKQYELPNFTNYWSELMTQDNYRSLMATVKSSYKLTAAEWCGGPCCCENVYVKFEVGVTTERDKQKIYNIFETKRVPSKDKPGKSVLAMLVDTTGLYNCKTKTWKWSLVYDPIFPVH